MNQKKSQLIQYFKWLNLSISVGILAGVSSSIFLILLDKATNYRNVNTDIVWLLPLAGLVIGVAYHFYGQEASRGNNLILEEIHNPRNVLPPRMAPMVLLGTVITHLFGGSAGREGTAIQMGASLSDQLGRIFRIDPDERKVLLVAGAGAGFGAAIGTPFAGIIFGMEVIQIGRLRLSSWPQCMIASFTGYYTGLILKAPHSRYPAIDYPEFSFSLVMWVLVAGVIFGITAFLFSRFTHVIEHLSKKIIKRIFLIPLFSGILLVVLYRFEGSYRYVGLGIPYIQEAIEKAASIRDPILKMFFTSLTVGTGFKGGEFVPLVYIGTTLGSVLGNILPISFSLLAAIGFAAVFAGAANTPLACAIMAAEIFGWRIFPLALIACYMSYYVSGHSGIYRAQIVYRRKHHRIQSALRALGELPQRFFNERKQSARRE